MFDFIISNYIVFIIIAVILLLGLFGYMMDRKKYEQYRQEIVNEEKAIESLEKAPELDNVATAVDVASNVTDESIINAIDPVTGEMKN